MHGPEALDCSILWLLSDPCYPVPQDNRCSLQVALLGIQFQWTADIQVCVLM